MEFRYIGNTLPLNENKCNSPHSSIWAGFRASAVFGILYFIGTFKRDTIRALRTRDVFSLKRKYTYREVRIGQHTLVDFFVTSRPTLLGMHETDFADCLLRTALATLGIVYSLRRRSYRSIARIRVLANYAWYGTLTLFNGSHPCQGSYPIPKRGDKSYSPLSRQTVISGMSSLWAFMFIRGTSKRPATVEAAAGLLPTILLPQDYALLLQKSIADRVAQCNQLSTA